MESIKGSATRVVMDQRLASSYVEALERLSKTLGKRGLDPVRDRSTNARGATGGDNASKSDELGALFARAMEKALRALEKMRSAEGVSLN